MYGNPVNMVKVGPAENGKQKVSLYDKQDKVYRTVNSTPDKVDEFISTKKENKKKALKISAIIAGALVAVGAAAGAIFGGKVIDANKIELAGLGALTGLVISGISDIAIAGATSKKNKKVNQEFIENNK